MKHQKHKQLTRPAWGQWGRNEWAIVGGKCSDIQILAKQIISALPDLKSLYIDADHKASESQGDNNYDTVTNKIGHFEWLTSDEPNKFVHRPRLANYNLILVNGNHFTAQSQIVIIDKDKENSLKKRLEELTNIELLLLHPNMDGQIFDWLENYLKAQKIAPPRAQLNSPANAINLIKERITPAPLKALLLVGGKSTRMGKDKASIAYHGIPQVEYVYALLKEKLDDVYISCRVDQMSLYDGYELITDSFDDLGPFGGLLSAFRSDPNAAWLVVACDLPMVNSKTFDQLITERDPYAAGTAFRSTHSEWMEPLIAIYEPSIYPTALGLLAQGYSCARKVMINSPVHIIDAKNTNWLINVNTPQDQLAVLKK